MSLPSKLPENKCTGLANMYIPDANNTRNDNPNDNLGSHFVRKPNKAKYNKPTNPPINRENRIIS